MNWQVLIPGLLLGALSSFHCIGMCGPIALLMPVRNLPSSQKIAGILLYNLGRIFTYTSLGVITGLAGRSIYLAGLQQAFSIALGLTIVIAAVFIFLRKKLTNRFFENHIVKKVYRLISLQINRKGLLPVFTIGLVNGLLPCGMVYFALAGAMATGSIPGSALFMTAFGLGTFPLMLLFNYTANIAGAQLRSRIKRLVPYFLAGMGVLLVMRGLNINIPFVSPMMNMHKTEVMECRGN